MPIYEYACSQCGRREEKLEAMNAPETHACPSCGAGSGMARQLSVAALAIGGGASPSLPSGGGCCPSGGCPYA